LNKWDFDRKSAGLEVDLTTSFSNHILGLKIKVNSYKTMRLIMKISKPNSLNLLQSGSRSTQLGAEYVIILHPMVHFSNQFVDQLKELDGIKMPINQVRPNLINAYNNQYHDSLYGYSPLEYGPEHARQK
jgi:hypothetical protein